MREGRQRVAPRLGVLVDWIRNRLANHLLVGVAACALISPDCAVGQERPGEPPVDVLEQSFVELTLWYYQFASGLNLTPDGQHNGHGTEIIHQADPGGCGSGFGITSDGIIVTNFHVVRRAQKIEAKLPDGSVGTGAELIAYDRANDIALVRLKLEHPVKPAELDESPARVFDRVYSVGNARCEGMSITEGMVNRVCKDGNGAALLIQHSAAIAPGNSGGPLYRGTRVIGVNSSSWVPYEIHFAVPAARIQDLLGKEHTPMSLRDVFPIDAAQIKKKSHVIGVTSGQVPQGEESPGVWVYEVELRQQFTDALVRIEAERDRDLAVAVYGSEGELVGYSDTRNTNVEELLFSLDYPSKITVWVLNHGNDRVNFGVQLYEIVW